MLRFYAGLAFLTSLTVSFSAGAVDYQETALRAAREFALPRYEALAGATKAQAQAWATFCKTPAPRDLRTLDTAYGGAADAWAGIEFLRYGPIGEEFRFERMAHWPERRNAVSRALSSLTTRPDAEVFTPVRFRETSVAGQGLSALERVLFEDETRSALRTGAASSKRLCLIGQAITGALAALSGEIVEEWQRETVPMLQKADESQAREAVTRFATDLQTGMQVIADAKLNGPLGQSIDNVRPVLAEMWRSKRATRTIRINLEAARSLAVSLFGPQPSDEAKSVLESIDAAISVAEVVPDDLGEAAADPRRRNRAVLLRDAVHSMREMTGTNLPAVLQITTGFNSLDGD